MIELTVLAVVGLTLLLFTFLVLAVIVSLLRGLVWLVLLPLKLLIALLFVPLQLLAGIVTGLFFLATGPLLAVTAIVAAVVVSVLLALPLAPLLLLLFGIWLITRGSRRPELVR